MGDGRVVLGLLLGCAWMYISHPSILTLFASPVKSYGGGARFTFYGAKPPLVYRTKFPPLGGGTPGGPPLWFIERSCDASLASFGFRRTVSRRWGADTPSRPPPATTTQYSAEHDAEQYDYIHHDIHHILSITEHNVRRPSNTQYGHPLQKRNESKAPS